ncbi:hypothetical protein Tco_0525594 [Tanacetum coccineum]
MTLHAIEDSTRLQCQLPYYIALTHCSASNLTALRAVYAEPEVIELKDSSVIDRLKITKLHSRVEYAETHLERSHVRQTGDGVRT